MIPLQEWHPVLVHFPIVLLLLLAATDLVLAASGRSLLDGGGASTVSTTLAVIAGAAAVVTFVFGDIAADIAMESGVPESLIETHETLGTITAVVAGLWALVRLGLWWKGRSGSSLRNAVVATEIVLAGLVIVTAYFGGDLVYHHGVAVVQSGA